MAFFARRSGTGFRTITARHTFKARAAAKLGLISLASYSAISRRVTVLDRIRVDPAVCKGRPTIRGLRITVEFVLKLLGDRYTAADIVREYPELEEDDVYQAAKY